jgi:hypothetical protein
LGILLLAFGCGSPAAEIIGLNNAHAGRTVVAGVGDKIVQVRCGALPWQGGGRLLPLAEGVAAEGMRSNRRSGGEDPGAADDVCRDRRATSGPRSGRRDWKRLRWLSKFRARAPDRPLEGIGGLEIDLARLEEAMTWLPPNADLVLMALGLGVVSLGYASGALLLGLALHAPNQHGWSAAEMVAVGLYPLGWIGIIWCAGELATRWRGKLRARNGGGS